VRDVTRRAVAALCLCLLALLALGALPAHLGSGDPHYMTVTPTNESGPALNVTDLPERRYPYLTGALAAEDGRSEPYRTGRFGLKESFAHSPFDEYDALVQRDPDVAEDGTALVVYRGQRYAVEVVRA
jgi:hypothetical protein